MAQQLKHRIYKYKVGVPTEQTAGTKWIPHQIMLNVCLNNQCFGCLAQTKFYVVFVYL